MIEQAFIDVTDLFHVQRTEGEPACFGRSTAGYFDTQHLQRFKQYPPAAKAAGQQGVSRLRFSLSRSGQVLSSGLGGSSGHAALDAETLAMVRRAQPFPAFPPDMKQASMSFSVPIQFSVR